jgi:parallel beta-helix repeat protein
MRGRTAALLGLVLVAARAGAFDGDVPLAVGDDRFGGRVVDIGGYAIGEGGVLASRVQFEGGPGLGIVSQANASDSLVASEGGSAPQGGSFAVLGALAVGAAGTVVFRADLQLGAVVESAIFAVPPGGPGSRVVAVGDPTPLGDGSTFTAIDLPAAAATGRIAFRASDSAGRQGLFMVADNVLKRVVLKGDSHPAIGAFVSFGAPALADDGAIAFFVSGGGTKKGILIAAPDGTLAPIATVGGLAPGGTFTAVDQPTIGADGVVVFRGTVKAGQTSGRGIFVWRTGQITRLVAEGDPAPGGGVYKTFGGPAVGPGGAVAFRATLSAPAEALVVVTDAARAVAAAGDPAFVGHFCPAVGGQICFGDPAFGPHGELAFSARLDDPAVTRALFRTRIQPGNRIASIFVDCNAGGRIQNALAQIADGGVIQVRGTCRENVVVADVGRVTISGVSTGKRRRRKPPVLIAADASRPALEVRDSAGPTTFLGFTVQGGRPAVRLDGIGHTLQGLGMRGGGGVEAKGGGHTVSGLKMVKVAGPCIAVSASATAVTRNTIRRCLGDGILVTGPAASLAINVVLASRGRGIAIESSSNSLSRNRVSGSRQGGLLVLGRNNTLAGNRAAGNRGGQIVAGACNIDAGRNHPKLRMPPCSPSPAVLATPRPVS